jgi:hypothetical protein
MEIFEAGHNFTLDVEFKPDFIGGSLLDSECEIGGS